MQEHDIKRFTLEAKVAIESTGRIIYPTSKSQVAVNPQGLILADTSNKTTEEDRKFFEDDTQRLRTETGTDELLRRPVTCAEVVEVYKAHLEATGQRLIQKFDLRYVKTETPVANDPTRTICVGDPTDSAGITFIEAKREPYKMIYLPDLILPA